MEPYLRQQFDMLLLTAADRFSERIAVRCEGQAQALRQLRDAPDGEGVWLADFVDAVFAEFCIDNAAGACFVLEAAQKRITSVAAEGTVADILVQMAKSIFAKLLAAKTAESLDRAERYG
jgi:hypothetical protein